MLKSDKLPISTDNVISVTAQTEAEYNINKENTFDTTDYEEFLTNNPDIKSMVESIDTYIIQQEVMGITVESMTVALKDLQTLLVNLVIEHV